MAELEGWTQEHALARCAEVDRMRERFNRYFFGEAATDWSIMISWSIPGGFPSTTWSPALPRWYAASGRRARPIRAAERRTLTLTGELGAGDSGMAPTLASG